MSPSKTDAVATAFSYATGEQFTREHIYGLIDGSLGAVRVPHLLSSNECDSLAKTISQIPFDTYNTERVVPPIVRFGPSLNDSRRDGELMASYWEQATKTRSLWQMIGLIPDPLAECRRVFAEAWGAPVDTATIDGKPVYAGVLREINGGALVHYDDVNREFPHGLFDAPVIGQLAFNIYISITTSGGETIVWERQWHDEDENYRRGYGYDEQVTAGARYLTIRPTVGDGLLFNPHNLHAVRPTRGGSRIAFAFFVGVTSDERLVMWS